MFDRDVLSYNDFTESDMTISENRSPGRQEVGALHFLSSHRQYSTWDTGMKGPTGISLLAKCCMQFFLKKIIFVFIPFSMSPRVIVKTK